MDKTASIFEAIADKTRREILHLLREGPLTAGEIASQFDMTQPSVSRHLSILKNADLVQVERKGNSLIYSANQESLATCLSEFIHTVCPLKKKK
jgi:DNA-binding transcriptional ArsR family regulator